MPLTCGCDDWDYDPEPGDWQYWGGGDDFEKLNTTKRKRCKSCKELIALNSFCLIFPRYRYPRDEIEARIVGTDLDNLEEPNIKIADHHLCETCGELYLNLEAVGYCVNPMEDMNKLLKEYQNRIIEIYK